MSELYFDSNGRDYFEVMQEIYARILRFQDQLFLREDLKNEFYIINKKIDEMIDRGYTSLPGGSGRRLVLLLGNAIYDRDKLGPFEFINNEQESSDALDLIVSEITKEITKGYGMN